MQHDNTTGRCSAEAQFRHRGRGKHSFVGSLEPGERPSLTSHTTGSAAQIQARIEEDGRKWKDGTLRLFREANRVLNETDSIRRRTSGQHVVETELEERVDCGQAIPEGIEEFRVGDCG